jgi:signal transduction histidine kinase
LPPGPSREHLDQARRTARENLVEARRLVAALRPEILEGTSLSGALGRLAERWSGETGVPATVSVTGDEHALAQETQVALLRAAQEALSNTRRHARAASVEITLSYMEDLVALDVQDDGEGFDPNGVAEGADGGFGLRAMRERVEAIGGSLLVESEPGAGCTLVVELPLVPGAEGATFAKRETK